MTSEHRNTCFLFVWTDEGMNYSGSRGSRKHKREDLKEENVSVAIGSCLLSSQPPLTESWPGWGAAPPQVRELLL